MHSPNEDGGAAVAEQPDTTTADVPHEASPADAPLGDDVPAAPSHERPELPVHKVLCMAKGCKAGATYRPTASGTGFFVLERYGMDVESLLGVGPNGRPICPFDEHGEMTLADEQLPIEQAITQVNGQLAAAQAPRLPFPAPAFNYEDVFRAIVEMRHEVARLEERYDDRKDAAKKAKEDLDDANEKLGKAIDDYEARERERRFEIERRQRQAEDGHPEGTTLVRCVYEQQHPEHACPICSGKTAAAVLERFLGAEATRAARDAATHLDEVNELEVGLEVDETLDHLGDVGLTVRRDVVREWTDAERAAVIAWASAEFDHDEDASITVPERPAILGTAHISAEAGEDASEQHCATCGAVLWRRDPESEDDKPWAAGLLVGTDCAGAEKEPHRYPDTSKKKASTRAPKEAAPAKAKKKAKK